VLDVIRVIVVSRDRCLQLVERAQVQALAGNHATVLRIAWVQWHLRGSADHWHKFHANAGAPLLRVVSVGEEVIVVGPIGQVLQLREHVLVALLADKAPLGVGGRCLGCGKGCS